MTDDDRISLKEFFETLIEERDRYYAEKIKYLETRIVSVDDKHTASAAAINAATQAAFAASEKAILKSEDGQKELNIKNNEFRGQLKDQAEHLMPRTESLANWKSNTERIMELKEQTEIKFDLVRKEIQVLRESRSEGMGKGAGIHASWLILLGTVGLISTLLSIVVLGITLFRR